jgi:hypothetical protein
MAQEEIISTAAHAAAASPPSSPLKTQRGLTPAFFVLGE